MTARGWCPGALRPMPAGDGLLLRIRAHGGRLTQQQVALVAQLANEAGNGQIDLGSRASMQLRGVTERSLPTLHQALRDADLLDPDPAVEARRNIMLNPFAPESGLGFALLAELEDGLRHGPTLPPKFGFAIDIGPVAALQDASADLRIEQSDGGLIIRADGMALGERVAEDHAAARVIELARWFSRQSGAKRMRGLVAAGRLPPMRADTAPRAAKPRAALLRRASLLFAAFGAVTADDLAALETGLRLTPWRAVLPDADPARIGTGWLTDPDDPLLRISACTGLPGCSAASVETRRLARQLAGLIPQDADLHVSGCAKGCACPHPARLTLTGRAGRFDLIRQGIASGPAERSGLSAADIIDLFRGSDASQL